MRSAMTVTAKMVMAVARIAKSSVISSGTAVWITLVRVHASVLKFVVMDITTIFLRSVMMVTMKMEMVALAIARLKLDTTVKTSRLVLDQKFI